MQDREGLFPFGRVPPLILCGEGARLWYRGRRSRNLSNIECYDAIDELVTPSQLKTWRKYHEMIGRKEYEEREKREEEKRHLENERKRKRPSSPPSPPSPSHMTAHTLPCYSTELPREDTSSPLSSSSPPRYPSQSTPSRSHFYSQFCDTVGAVFIDLGEENGLDEDIDRCGEEVRRGGCVAAAGVSSGGLWMKIPGRVGEAAIYGAGCWADERREPLKQEKECVSEREVTYAGDRVGVVGCSVTGLGEMVIRDITAARVSQRILQSAPPTVIVPATATSLSKLPASPSSCSQSTTPSYSEVADSPLSPLSFHFNEALQCDTNVTLGAQKDVGLIAVHAVSSRNGGEREEICVRKREKNVFNLERVEIHMGHTTQSMGVAWMSHLDRTPHSRISRLEEGRKFTTSTIALSINSKI